MQLGDTLLSGPTLLNGALKLAQASSELVTFAPHLGKLGCEGVAFGGKDGELLPGIGPGRGDEDAAAATQHRAASSWQVDDVVIVAFFSLANGLVDPPFHPSDVALPLLAQLVDEVGHGVGELLIALGIVEEIGRSARRLVEGLRLRLRRGAGANGSSQRMSSAMSLSHSPGLRSVSMWRCKSAEATVMRDLHFAPRLHSSRPHRPVLPESGPTASRLPSASPANPQGSGWRRCEPAYALRRNQTFRDGRQSGVLTALEPKVGLPIIFLNWSMKGFEPVTAPTFDTSSCGVSGSPLSLTPP
jgi:hypothetical protein